MKISWGTALLLGGAAVLLALAGCDSITGEDSSSSPIKFISTSGAEVSINGTWIRGNGCIASGGQSERNEFKFDGSSMILAFLEWWLVPDCSGQNDVSTTIKAKVTYDQPVTMTGWVDPSGSADVPPGSLTDVEEANGSSATFNSASVTPETAAAATEFNNSSGCGFTDWAAGKSKDVPLSCIFGSNPTGPQKTTFVLDDTTSTTTLSMYESADGTTTVDADGYPTEIENFDPLKK